MRERVAELQSSLPKGMKVDVLFDSTQFIKDAVDEIELELVMAVVLTAFVCWLFLGSLSSTMNVVLAIPMSLLGTIAVAYGFGFTLNTFTLLGLSLAVGLVVDDAIMVMENIFRHAEMGKDKKLAASDGTKEITFAALAATLAVIAIFLPVIFMNGVIGKFFFQFGVTLSVAVMLSYFEAITLAPARCSADAHDGSRGPEPRRPHCRCRVRSARTHLRSFARVQPALAEARAVGGRLCARRLGRVGQARPDGIPCPRRIRAGSRCVCKPRAARPIEAAAPLLAKVEARLAKHKEIEHTMVTLSSGSGQYTLNLVPPAQRQLSAQALMGVVAQGAARHSGRPRVDSGSFPAELRRRQGLAPSRSRSAARIGISSSTPPPNSRPIWRRAASRPT